MERHMKKLFALLPVLLTVILLSGNSFAQDVTVTDPDHNKVEFENDEMRVIRVTHNPGDISLMHSHPEGLVIFLTDVKVRMTMSDGMTKDAEGQKGQVMWLPAITHSVEYLGDEPGELIHIEMKSKK